MPRETLRSLTSRVPEPRQAEEMMLALHKEGDRTAAIVGASMVESALQELITSSLKSRETDIAERLFDNRGPLSDFNSKIVVAQAFSVITDGMADDLQRIRRIRNCFAHARLMIDFENPLIAREVSELAAVVAVRSTEHHYPIGSQFPYKSHKTSYALSCYIFVKLLAAPTELVDPRSFTDERLRHAYAASGGEAGDPFADALAGEIERRNLDI
jgi:DNA-binding MltR family transcriptional regulator